MCVVFADLGSVLRPDREDYPSADLQKVLTMIPLVLGIVVMACLAVGLLADLYVTASGIL